MKDDDEKGLQRRFVVVFPRGNYYEFTCNLFICDSLELWERKETLVPNDNVIQTDDASRSSDVDSRSNSQFIVH